MKLTKLKNLHTLYLLLSMGILLLYIINPDFLVYNMHLFFNIILVILLILQLWQIIYSKKDETQNQTLVKFNEFLDLLVPVVSLYIGVNRINF